MHQQPTAPAAIAQSADQSADEPIEQPTGQAFTARPADRPGDVTVDLAAFVADVLPAVFAAARQDPTLSVALARMRIGQRPVVLEAVAAALSRESFRAACRASLSSTAAGVLAAELRTAAVDANASAIRAGQTREVLAAVVRTAFGSQS